MTATTPRPPTNIPMVGTNRVSRTAVQKGSTAPFHASAKYVPGRSPM